MSIRRFSRHPYHFTQGRLRERNKPFRFSAPSKSIQRFQISVIAATILMGGLFYWLFFSAAFHVQTIKINANLALPAVSLRELIENQIQTQWLGFIPQRNIFAFDTQELRSSLSKTFAIDKLLIKKDRPHEIQIHIEEKPRRAIWITRNRHYALDAQGAVLGTVANFVLEASKETLVFYDRSGGEVTPQRALITPTTLAFAASVYENHYIQSLTPRFFVVAGPQATDLELKVTEGWNINFDTAAALENQIKNLELALRNSVSPDERKNLAYIDLRFGERVYFKYRD